MNGPALIHSWQVLLVVGTAAGILLAARKGWIR